VVVCAVLILPKFIICKLKVPFKQQIFLGLVLIQLLFVYIASLGREWVNPGYFKPDYNDFLGEDINYYKLRIHRFTGMTQFSKSLYSLRKCIVKNQKYIGKCFYGYLFENEEDLKKIALQLANYIYYYTHFSVFNYYFVGDFFPIVIGCLTVAFVFKKPDIFNSEKV
jgi:hypothetical protein